MDFYELLEKYLRSMTDMRDYRELSGEEIQMAFSDLAKLFGICKITVTYYENQKMESLGVGNEFVYYDMHEECRLVHTDRFITGAMTVVVCKVYQAMDAEKWTPEEYERVKMLQNTSLVFASRNRMKRMLEIKTYSDSEGYPNLQSFFRLLMQLATQQQITGKACMHFNLNHFGLVNQQVGRKVGDLVLKRFFEDLTARLEEKGTVCRIGGDNFVLICEAEMIEIVLDFLQGHAVCYDDEQNSHIMVSAAVGVYVTPEYFVLKDPGEIMDKIMTASQIAKSGDEGVVFYDEKMQAQKNRSAWVHQCFPKAITDGEFKVYYQPKVSVDNVELAGAEALCRWFYNGRLIQPLEFIPVLERGMDICKLDFYMLDAVCKDIRRWLDEGREVCRISVNLSRKHMSDMDLLHHILQVIDENNVPHEYIEIELTETTTDVEFKDLKRVVSGLRKSGVYTAVDDFGIGFSSLNLICEIPWDVLKVDRSFLPIQEDDDSSVRSIMFRNVVSMAKELGMECVAEGVETKEQFEILKENGCDMAQGFFFDKPIPVEEFEERLASKSYKKVINSIE